MLVTSIFSFFHSFSKTFLFRVVKSQDCVINVVIECESKENLAGKGENYGDQHFPLFTQGLQNKNCPWVMKTQECVVKDNLQDFKNLKVTQHLIG